MTKVICLLEECQYCKDSVCTAEEITLYEDHVCDGGCDDGWSMDDEDEDDDWQDDPCWECTGYGDDYYFDEDGELVCACNDCPDYKGRRVGDEAD